MRSKFIAGAGALAGAALLACSASATTFTISDLQAGEVTAQSLTAGGKASGSDSHTTAWAQTDFGLNRLYIDARGRPNDDYNTYVASIWGENFAVSDTAAGPVNLTFTVSVDGVAGPLVGEGEPPPFNFFLKAVKGPVSAFETEDEENGVLSYEDVSVLGVPVDGPTPDSPLVLGSATLCPITTFEGGSCPAAVYPPTAVTLSFTVNPGDRFFVLGALMVEDLVAGTIDFSHTAKLVGITALTDAGAPAGLTSDSGRLVDRGDGSYGIAAVPEPGTWALMILGFGAAGAALRARRRTVSA
ncbi:MAG: hypothetical protein A2790_10720 [Phenylobacterium sp. RIFCSPHIGHO2_01_FULL_69_31]|uniref:PEPxxWA-CTERM sorting domain-containing protein n=1 Tax=Phenylobacterium sp. RIFCSPHIGHO2_01_FULL_69_31 TaxID=1801944 RepID=UPI0008D8693F|nr:PEPxxWA-CTERM sorting domain-containing protein [Phenylobacterium sp. RIFCSPHIGHO2_01_FULL_69_31]OHB31114.1 MAG: hypothetical protein A2790_10720 [Phenylobacterium sp. RIFCSPHIGHO2_01_FULL_69_31]